MTVSNIARSITEEVFGGPPFSIGDRVTHPDGYLVEITQGQWWGTYGLSNFWYWKRVSEDGSLSDEEECGYGWRSA